MKDRSPLESDMGNDAEDLAWRRSQAAAGGGIARLEALRAAGRATARERVDALLDPNSFIEIDALVSHRNREDNMHLHPSLEMESSLDTGV